MLSPNPGGSQLPRLWRNSFHSLSGFNCNSTEGKKNTTQKKEKKEKHSEKKRGKAAPDKSDGRFYTSEKLWEKQSGGRLGLTTGLSHS